MARPNVEIQKGNGALGGVVDSADGISMLVISVPSTYPNPTNLVFLSLKDAQDAGITEANDTANNCLVWEHIKDFYTNAPVGTELHLHLIDEAGTITELFTVGNALRDALEVKLASLEGKVRLLGVAQNPSADESLQATSVSSDLQAAIPLAQAFAVSEFDKFRPINVIFEGRKFSGTIGASEDLRALGSNAVSVMVGRDEARREILTTNGNTASANYAMLGYALGRLAAIPVQRDMGRVIDGAMPGIAKASLSGGQLLSGLTDGDLNALHDKGYIFFTRHAGKNGFYFITDPTCVSTADDYAYISRGRTIDKVARIARRVYLDFLLDEVVLDEEGRLAPIVVKTFESAMRGAIEREMQNLGEISSVSVTVDPNQNVLSTGKIESLIQAIPVGIARLIKAIVQFENPNVEV